MTDTNNFVVERNNSDVEAENSGSKELKSNSECNWQESELIHQIRSGLEARSGQNAGGDVPVLKLPASLRTPLERFTPPQWQFGLHNRDSQASSSQSQVLKIRLAAACKLNPDILDKFCAGVVDNPADMMPTSYRIYSNEFSTKEVQYLLTLEALTLVLVLSSIPSAERLLDLFIWSLVNGDFNIAALLDGVAYCRFLDDLYLCENQILMALIKKVISKCYGLLPDDERKFNFAPELEELENLDSTVTKEFLDKILKVVANVTCWMFFSEPCPENDLLQLIHVNYEVGKPENCAHVFACIHKVMTSCVESTRADKKPFFNLKKLLFYLCRQFDTEGFAPEVSQPLQTDVEALPTVGTPIAVTTTFRRSNNCFCVPLQPVRSNLPALLSRFLNSAERLQLERASLLFN
jgi:hypothetical protein